MFYISIHIRIQRSFWWCCLSSIESFERYEIFKINFSLCSLVRIVQGFALKILKSNLEYLVRFEAFVIVWAAPSERAPNSDMDPYIKHRIWSTGSKIISFFSFAWKSLWWYHQKTLNPLNFWWKNFQGMIYTSIFISISCSFRWNHQILKISKKIIFCPATWWRHLTGGQMT